MSVARIRYWLGPPRSTNKFERSNRRHFARQNHREKTSEEYECFKKRIESIIDPNNQADDNNDESPTSFKPDDSDANNDISNYNSDEESESQDGSSSEEEEETEVDFEPTNPLLQHIRERVSRALSATGMAIP